MDQKRLASPTSQAMRRLQNVESAVEREGRVLEGVLGDMDGLKVRSRLMGREVKEVRRAVDEGGLVREEMGRVMEVRMDEICDQVKDLEDLTSSVHGVMAKQVGLISGVVTKVRGLEQEVGDMQRRLDEVRGEGLGDDVEQGEEMGQVTGKAEAKTISKRVREREREGDGQEKKNITSQQKEVVNQSVVRQVVTREKDGTVVYSFDS